MSMFPSVLFISGGAVIGACLRWGLGNWLNPLFSGFSFGTLIANYLGCFAMGLFFALFWAFPQISNEWKLFLVTGLLGSLTTFSSFSIEVINDLFNGKFGVGIGLIIAHLIGGLLCTLLGVWLMRAVLK